MAGWAYYGQYRFEGSKVAVKFAEEVGAIASKEKVCILVVYPTALTFFLQHDPFELKVNDRLVYMGIITDEAFIPKAIADLAPYPEGKHSCILRLCLRDTDSLYSQSTRKPPLYPASPSATSAS